jgi:hypothetical protein
VRHYTLFCLAALFLVVVCLADRGLGWWCLLPALIGGASLLAHWGLGPPLVIVSMTGLMLSGARYRGGSPYWVRNQVPTLLDLVLGVAVLGYAMGYYRLLSLVRNVFPPDPRRPEEGTRADPARRRSADLVSAREMALLGLTLPLWTGLSVVAWGWLLEDMPPLGVPIEMWRMLWVGWVVLAVLAATAAVATYHRLTTATPEEGLLYLQDQLWRQTRREQASLNRWLAWARLRARRRREMS